MNIILESTDILAVSKKPFSLQENDWKTIKKTEKPKTQSN
jgi:hypothetical protein